MNRKKQERKKRQHQILSEVRLTEELSELNCYHQTQSPSNMNPCPAKLHITAHLGPPGSFENC